MCGAPKPVNTSDRQVNTLLGPIDNPNFVATEREVFERDRARGRMTQLPFLPPPQAQRSAQFLGSAQQQARDTQGRALDRTRRGASGLRIPLNT